LGGLAGDDADIGDQQRNDQRHAESDREHAERKDRTPDGERAYPPLVPIH
jgi:hypothetical protein